MQPTRRRPRHTPTRLKAYNADTKVLAYNAALTQYNLDLAAYNTAVANNVVPLPTQPVAPDATTLPAAPPVPSALAKAGMWPTGVTGKDSQMPVNAGRRRGAHGARCQGPWNPGQLADRWS